MRRFFIFKLWQTGNVGSHNIAKIDGQKKEGYTSYNEAWQDIDKLRKYNCDIDNYPVVILEVFSQQVK